MAAQAPPTRSDDCIQVVVRCRPLNKKEKEENRGSIVDIDMELRQININNPANKDENKSFAFDAVYDENTIQRTFYEESCFNLVESVLEGFNGTIFAYGQTGCGKSWTMQGPTNLAQPELRGVIPNAFAHIFESVKATANVEFLIRVSYLEIYNEEIKDLLGNPKAPVKCEIKEDPNKGVFIKGLADVVVESEQEMTNALEKGLLYRTTAATNMNEQSSRSHSIFSIVVEMSTKDPDSGKEMIRAGKLNLVDLAGSERQKKTGATGDLLKEGAKINLSLSALGNVISALSEGKPGKHVPYRDSKLTRLLQDSLGGNTKTLMVAAISPADYNYDETTSTLRYANRAKNIKNKPKINEDPKDTMLREFKAQIEALKKMLADQQSGATPLVTLGARSQDGDGGEERSFAAVSKSTSGVAGGEAVSSAKVRSLEQEKERVHAQLAEKEGEIERERQMREELVARLAQMQGKLMGHADSADGGPSESPEEVAERAEAAKRLKERRQKAKAKRKAKEAAEMARIKQEKEALEDELAQLGEAEEAKAELEKKLSKMRKKYEKRVQTLRQEADDARDDMVYQHQQLIEAYKEQEKESKLFETIARSLAGDKEIKRIVAKARYNEEDDTWVLPFTKRQSFDGDSGGGNNGRNSTDSLTSLGGNGVRDIGGIRGGGAPDMSQCIRMGGSDSASNMLPSSSSSALPSLGGKGNKMPGILGGGSNSSGNELPSLGGGGLRGARALGGGGHIPVTSHIGEDDIVSFATGSGYVPYGIDYVGSAAGNDYSSFSQLPKSTSNSNAYADEADKDEADRIEREKRARKKQLKAEKKAKQQQEIEVAAAANNGPIDLEGGTGVAAGVVSDWGWANANPAAALSLGEPEPAYSDDEDFEITGGAQGKVSKSSSMPSMKNSNSKSKKPKEKASKGLSLPAI